MFAGVLANAAGKERTHLVQSEIVVIGIVRRDLIRRHVGTGVVERREDHRRQRHIGLPTLPAPLGIAADLEGATKWRELWSVTTDMAGSAGLTRLRGKVGRRFRRIAPRQPEGRSSPPRDWRQPSSRRA